jgi:hypothetical protein
MAVSMHGCMDAWMHGGTEPSNHAVMQSCCHAKIAGVIDCLLKIYQILNLTSRRFFIIKVYPGVIMVKRVGES